MLRYAHLLFACILLTGSVWTGLPKQAYAVDPDVIQAFIREGDQRWQEGLPQRSIDSYSRAVLLDPGNITARNRLISLADESSLEGDVRVQLLMLKDTIITIQQLVEKTDYFLQKREQFIADMRARGVNQELMELELSLVDKRFSEKQGEIIKDIRQAYIESDEPFQIVVSSLEQKRKEIALKLEQIKEQYARLQALNKREKPSVALTVTSKDLARLPRLKKTFRIEAQSGLPETATASKGEGEIVELSLSLEESKKMLRKKDDQIQLLKNGLESINAQLALNERIIDEKNNELLELNQQLADLQSQLKLRGMMVQEKEERIEHLQEESVSSRKNLLNENATLKQLVAEQNKDIRQLEAMMGVYQNRVARLKRGLDARDNIRTTQAPIGQMQNELAQSQQLAARTAETFKEMMEEKEKTIQQKNQHISELNGIVRMYKTLLKESSSQVTASNRKLGELEKEFTQLKKSLTKKSQLLLDAEYKLLSLKKELTSVQTRLIALRNLPETKDYAQLEGEMEAIEERIATIHNFLLKQLDDFEKLNKDFIAGDLKDIDRVLNLDLKRIQSD